MYMGQSAYMQVNDWFSEACQIGRGVRHGCFLSPLLYIIYDEAIVKEATKNVQEGISVGGATVSLIRHADDKAVVASSQRGRQPAVPVKGGVTGNAKPICLLISVRLYLMED